MPDPMNYESEEAWMEACVPTRIDEGDEQDQAVAVCMSMWKERKSEKPKKEYKAGLMEIVQIEERTVKQLFGANGRVDDGDDRIINGAYKKTLLEHADRVKVLWQHDFSMPPVGKPLVVKEIGTQDLPSDYKSKFPEVTGALYGEVEYLDTDRGNEILAGIKAGAITENSIGYDAIKFDYQSEDGRKVRNLREVRLWDISPVNWGMQPAAVNLKSAVERFDKGELDMDALIPELCKAFQVEQKVGRVLSARSLERIQKAMQELSDLLLSAEPPQDNEEEILKTLTEKVRMKLAIAEREYNLMEV